MTQSRTRSAAAERLIGGLLAIGGILTIALTLLAFMESGVSGETRTQPPAAEDGRPAPGTLITGTVTGADGPVADMQVDVALWPADGDTKVGEAVDLFWVEPVRTDANGRYAVILPIDDVPSKYLMQGGVVNLDIMLDEGRVGPISTPVRHPSKGSWWVDADGMRHDSPLSMDFDLAARTATGTWDDGRSEWPLHISE